MKTNQVVYKQGDPAEERVYIVVVGKVALKSYLGPELKFETIGYAATGDTFGEEGAYEIGDVKRKETTMAEEDTYILEILKQNLMVLQGYLKANNLSMDWFTLNNFMKK